MIYSYIVFKKSFNTKNGGITGAFKLGVTASQELTFGEIIYHFFKFTWPFIYDDLNRVVSIRDGHQILLLISPFDTIKPLVFCWFQGKQNLIKSLKFTYLISEAKFGDIPRRIVGYSSFVKNQKISSKRRSLLKSKCTGVQL